MVKAEPPVIYTALPTLEEAVKGAPAAAFVLPQERTWKRHFCNVFGDCSCHDWAHCCLAQWVPCVSFGQNMRRALNLNVWLQALLYLTLFGGIAHVATSVADKQCPMWEPNPAYVALYGEPRFPPPPGFPLPHHKHHHHHHGDEHHHEHHHPEGTDSAFAAAFPHAERAHKPTEPAFEFEVEVDFSRNVPQGADGLEVPMDEIQLAPVDEARPAMEQRRHQEHAEEVHKHAKKICDFLKKISKAVLGPMHKLLAKHHAEGERRELHEHHGEPKHGKHTHQGPDPYRPVKKCVKVHVGVLAGALVVGFFAAMYAAKRRSQIRERFGIAGTRCRDFAAWLCCPFCALVQESRTLSHHHVEDGVWPEEAQYAAVPTVVVMQA